MKDIKDRKSEEQESKARGSGTPKEMREKDEKSHKREHREEMIDESIEETFPASDPPSYMPPGKSSLDDEPDIEKEEKSA